jgi:hypothetical protein
MWFIMAVAALAAQAQVSDQIRRATLTGSGGASGSGKCTIEVRVDMSAEVDVYGDSGRLRTLAGQSATWTRMECTAPLPYNMSDFRFRGVDGRGTAKLIQDPRNNNSMAVIRIDDPKSGSEGYTFDIEWSGASGGTPNSGFSTGWGTPATGGTASSLGQSAAGGWGTGRGARMSAENAIDLCRTEVRARGERDYGLRNIDITSAAVDTGQGRRNWVTGAFRSRGGNAAYRGSGYRFNCEIDYASNQVRNVEFLRTDGSTIQPTGQSGISDQSAPYGSSGYDQSRVLRACQDAVVARTNRDGYQNVSFESTVIDTSRADWVSGVLTAHRGPVTDSFTFGCSMDMRAASVRNLEFNRR